MTSFVITGYTTTTQTLTGGQTGFLTNADAELIVTGGYGITTSGNVTNYLNINGTVAMNGTAGWTAINASGGGLRTIIGATGHVTAGFSQAILGNMASIFEVQNAGLITAASAGIQAGTSDGGAVIYISNTGTIQATTYGVIADSGDQTMRIINTGTILGAGGFGVVTSYQSYDPKGTSTLVNSGTITGLGGSYDAGGADGINVIRNDGIMNGQILLGLGADTYEGGNGRVTGAVQGEEGNDTLAGGALTDVLDGGDDDDILVGRGGDDIMNGGSGHDRLLGGSGNDSMSGGTGNDTLSGNGDDDTMAGDDGDDLLAGQDGSDSLDGGTGNDTLDGGDGNDVLEGGDDTDVLRGRNGEDELSGGTGLDFLTGGADADVFVFRNITHAGIGATRDQILDFEQGLDQINVVGMSPGVFEFRGTAAFAPSGNPELRLFETPTGSTIVQFDVNGDGTVDAEIRVANVTGLTAEDFAL